MHRSISKQTAIKYQPTGNRNQGLPLKRLPGCYIERGTGQEAQILCKNDDDDDDDDAYLFGLRITILHINIYCKMKIKLKLSLHLIKHHTVKTYRART